MTQNLNQNFLVIGDIMLDRYLKGQTSIAPEGVVNFLPTQPEWSKLGGVGNVILQLSQIGKGKAIVGIAEDKSGRQIQSLLKGSPIEPTYIQIPQTTTKTRYLDETDGKLLFRLSEEIKSDPVLDFIPNDYDITVISDYDKGMLNERNVSKILSKSTSPVIVNPKIENIKFYAGVDCLVLNEFEARTALGLPAYKKGSRAILTAKLYELLQVGCLIITLGEKGACYQKRSEGGIVDTYAREVVDATGAGDTFFSVVAALWGKMDIRQIIRYANAAAGECVSVIGNHIPNLVDILTKPLNGSED